MISFGVEKHLMEVRNNNNNKFSRNVEILLIFVMSRST